MLDSFQALRTTRKNLLLACGVVVLVGALITTLHVLAGAPAAQSCYVSIMFLVSPIRKLPTSWAMFSGLWAVLVALLGFAIGSLGTWPLMACLALVCLVQGLFRAGQVAAMTRGPANLVLFAGISMSNADAHLWQIALGSIAGVVVLLVAGGVLVSSRPTEPPAFSVGSRFSYGAILAAGSLLILLLSELTHFAHPNWALLSLCLILAVDEADRTERVRLRFMGTLAGALAAIFIAELPSPAIFVVTFICAILCVTYSLAGTYLVYVFFLTVTVLLTAATAHTAEALAMDRIVALGVASIVALICAYLSNWIRDFVIDKRSSQSTPDSVHEHD